MLPLKLWYPVFFPAFYFRVVILVMMVTYGDEKARGMFNSRDFSAYCLFLVGRKKDACRGGVGGRGGIFLHSVIMQERKKGVHR